MKTTRNRELRSSAIPDFSPWLVRAPNLDAGGRARVDEVVSCGQRCLALCAIESADSGQAKRRRLPMGKAAEAESE